MKMKFNNKYVKWGITSFIIIAAGLCFYYLIFNVSELMGNIKAVLTVIMPVIFGLVIAYLLTPVLNYIEYHILYPICNLAKIKESKARNKIVRAISILLTVILVIFVLYGVISMLVSQIVPSIQNIVSNFDTYIRNLSAWLNNLLADNQEVKDYVISLVTKFSGDMEEWLADTTAVLDRSGAILKSLSLSVIGFLKVLWNFIIGFVISIYVLGSKEIFVGQAKKIVYASFSQDMANAVIDSMRFTHKTFIGFISGKILDSFIIGILCFVGTSLMGTPYAVLVSVIIGFTNVIPFFGPYLGAIPSAILILIVDLSNPMNCVYFVLFILVLQQIDGNLIGPMILGDSTGLSGFWVIFSITVFGGLFGILGMIVGVPIFAVFYAAVRAVVNRSLEKKKMPLETDSYLNVGAIDEEGVHEYIPETKQIRSVKPRAGKKRKHGNEKIDEDIENMENLENIKNVENSREAQTQQDKTIPEESKRVEK